MKQFSYIEYLNLEIKLLLKMPRRHFIITSVTNQKTLDIEVRLEGLPDLLSDVLREEWFKTLTKGVPQRPRTVFIVSIEFFLMWSRLICSRSVVLRSVPFEILRTSHQMSCSKRGKCTSAFPLQSTEPNYIYKWLWNGPCFEIIGKSQTSWHTYTFVCLGSPKVLWINYRWEEF